MERFDDVQSAYLELEQSHNYLTMDDFDLYQRMNYWKMEYDFSPRGDRNKQEIHKILFRLALEITERDAEEKAALAVIEPAVVPMLEAA